MVVALVCRHPSWFAFFPCFLLVAACVFASANMALAVSPTLVRVVDGSSNPVASQAIMFRNVGFPDGKQTFYAAQNPLIQGRNLYAPDMVRTATGWNNYYGGWRTTGQVDDLIYMSTINGLDTSGTWSAPQAIISNGVYHHVNDPTVVIHGGSHHMLYTAARWNSHPQFGTYFRDWINYSTSSNGVSWTPSSGTTSTEIALSDPLGLAPGTLTSIARPSLVKTDFGWKMWFDGNAQGQPGAGIHSYLAHSVGSSPMNFEIVHRYSDISGFPGFFEPDVVLRPDGTYLAVVQRHFSQLYFATSTDGINFAFQGPVLNVSHPFYPRDHVSNPGLIYDQINDVNYGVSFGMANSGLTDHDIGFAYTQYLVQVRSPGNVWHTLSRSGRLDEQLVSVFDFTTFDLVRIIDPLTNAILLQQEFSGAQVGDVWELRFEQPLGGDFNGDGVVDTADYVLWRKTDLPQDDYNAWRANFGATAASGAGLGLPFVPAVPEPPAGVMLITAVWAQFFRRRAVVP